MLVMQTELVADVDCNQAAVSSKTSSEAAHTLAQTPENSNMNVVPVPTMLAQTHESIDTQTQMPSTATGEIQDAEDPCAGASLPTRRKVLKPLDINNPTPMYVVLGSIMVNTLELIFWMAGTFAIVIGLRRTHTAIALHLTSIGLP